MFILISGLGNPTIVLFSITGNAIPIGDIVYADIAIEFVPYKDVSPMEGTVTDRLVNPNSIDSAPPFGAV